MTNRKSSMTGMSGDATANSQENFTAIYTAHQVHTIANLIYRQLTGGWNAQTPWSPTMGAAASPSFMNPGGYGMMPGAAAMPMQHAPAGFAGAPGPMPPPALFYWYP